MSNWSLTFKINDPWIHWIDKPMAHMLIFWYPFSLSFSIEKVCCHFCFWLFFICLSFSSFWCARDNLCSKCQVFCNLVDGLGKKLPFVKYGVVFLNMLFESPMSNRTSKIKLEEELRELNSKIGELSSETGETAIQKLQDEIRVCKNMIKCTVCSDRPKEVTPWNFILCVWVTMDVGVGNLCESVKMKKHSIHLL